MPSNEMDAAQKVAKIGAAIDTRHILEIHSRYQRLWLEPSCVGTNEDGRWLLWAWQLNAMPGWRLFLVDDITELRDTDEIFFPSRSGCEFVHSTITTIYARADVSRTH